MNPNFDENLNVSKDQMMLVINAVIKRWKKNAWNNKTHIAAGHAFKLGVMAMSEDTFRQLWTELVRFSNELIAYNEVARLKNEMPKSEDFVNLFIQKIESGKFVD